MFPFTTTIYSKKCNYPTSLKDIYFSFTQKIKMTKDNIAPLLSLNLYHVESSWWYRSMITCGHVVHNLHKTEGYA